MKQWPWQSLVNLAICTLFVFFSLPSLAAVNTPATWQGEKLFKRTGVVYMKAIVENKAKRQRKISDHMTATVKVLWKNILTKKRYLLSIEPGNVGGFPKQLWILPSGKYLLQKISVSDLSGKTRTWKPLKKTTILVRPKTASNLGVAQIFLLKGKKIAVKMKMGKNKLTGNNQMTTHIKGVINGFNNDVQESFQTRKKKPVRRGSAGKDIAFRSTITISMFYSLDLLRHNYYAKEAIKAINHNDPELRQCYSDAIQEEWSLKGNTRFRFLLSKNTGTMKKVKFRDGSIKDPVMIKCLSYVLAQIQFSNKENMIGEININFSTR